MALGLLRRGTPRHEIINRTGFTSDELFLIEQNYYNEREMLDERAQTIKQLDRLEALLDMAYKQVEVYGLANEKGDFGANLTAFTNIVKEISELAGLKKQRVQTEVRIIEEEQINLVVSFVDMVMDGLVNKMYPLLSKAGKAELEAHKADWFAEVIESQSSVLNEHVAI